MFFILSKLLSFLFSPLPWILIIGLIAWFSRNKKRKNILLGCSMVMLYLFSNAYLLDETMRMWEVKAVPTENMKNYKVGIVLGGMSSYDKKLKRINFYQGVDRLLQAVELYERGCIKKIFISGGSGSMLHKDERESIPLKSYLVSIHIPEEDILIESESKNTYENAVYTSEALKKLYPKDEPFLLITSGFHMRRALLCFQKEGLTVTPYSTDRYSGKRKFELDHLLVPNTNTLNTWNILFHEWLGMISYKLSGYI
jgi:uncharacterized SAM-binding protein YcdF (DUF218 family)